MNMYLTNRLVGKISIFIIFILAGVFITAQASDPATLTFIGHSFVKLSTSEGKVIYIDPFAVNAFADSADVVLITHEHGDHNDLSRVLLKATGQVIRSTDVLQNDVYQTLAVGEIGIQGVPAYNKNHSKSTCVGYIVTFDGIKIYHAGDTGKIDEMADLAAQGINYALIPMDGIYTMTPEEATEAAALIQAKHDISIHTMPPPDTYSMEIVARFTSPNKLVVNQGETIELEKSATSIHQNAKIVENFSLGANYPNPFNPSTTITFHAARVGDIAELVIFDLLGNRIATLFNGPVMQNQIRRQWDGTSESGDAMPAGIYFASLKTGSLMQTIKLTYMK